MKTSAIATHVHVRLAIILLLHRVIAHATLVFLQASCIIYLELLTLSSTAYPDVEVAESQKVASHGGTVSGSLAVVQLRE